MHKRHPLLDGLMIGALTVASFGVFYFVLAQTTLGDTTLTEADPRLCGNLICDVAETSTSCPVDCVDRLGETLPPPSSPGPVCGNAICETLGGESSSSCPSDCHIAEGTEGGILPVTNACGNRFCDAGETLTTCPADCPAPIAGAVCGNAVCEILKGESNASCPHDCPAPPPTFAFPQPCVERGITDPEECRHLMDSLGILPSSEPVAAVCGNKVCETAQGETQDTCAVDCGIRTAEVVLPQACVERGIRELDECKRYMDSLRSGTATQPPPPGTTTFQLPQACVERGITDPEECKKLTESLRGDETVQKPVFTKECIEKGIKDLEECKRFTATLGAGGAREGAGVRLPELCRLKGITSPEECKKLMTGVFKAAAGQEHAENGPPAGKGSDDGKFDFSTMLPKDCVEAKVADPKGCRELMRSQAPKAGETHFPQECQAKGLKTLDDCRKFFEERSILPECKDLGAKTLAECKSLLAAQHLPVECRDKGVADEKECRSLLEKSFMPKTCDAQGAKTLDECKPMLLDKYGRPDECAGLDDVACWRLIEAGKVDKDYREKLENDSKAELPEKCFEAGASNYGECERKFEDRSVPSGCRDAGIFTRDGCEKHLFEKSRSEIAGFLPGECAEAGVEDPDACKKLMEARYFPRECADAEIADLEECKRFLVLKHMPAECRSAGMETKDDCEKLLRARLMTPTCEAQGITTQAACEEFIYGHISGGVSCRGFGSEECAIAMKGRHLGAILHANEHLDDIEKKIADAASENGTIDLAALAIRGDDVHDRMTEILPIRPRRERKLRALRSNGQIAVNGDDTVDAAAGTLIAYDTDGDGLPDDVEARHGLDPEKADTDGDGEPDADELRKLKPRGFDKALVDGEAIGQPLSEGETDPALTVTLAPAGAEGGDIATALSGTGTPGDIVTLYVYSELPVVVTTTVDANGQWSYEMSDGLQEGTHEVYVAVNDDTGKVVKKSDPLSLLIRGASAATAADVAAEGTAAAEAVAIDAQANASEGSRSETDVRAFLFLGAALLFAVALIVAVLVMRKRKKDKDRQDGNLLT